jgi:hypothetical protein
MRIALLLEVSGNGKKLRSVIISKKAGTSSTSIELKAKGKYRIYMTGRGPERIITLYCGPRLVILLVLHFVSDPTNEHWNTWQSVFEYYKGTLRLGIYWWR